MCGNLEPIVAHLNPAMSEHFGETVRVEIWTTDVKKIHRALSKFLTQAEDLNGNRTGNEWHLVYRDLYKKSLQYLLVDVENQ